MKYSFTEFSPNVSDTTVVRGTKCRQIVYYTPVIKTRLINNCFALLVLSIKQTLASAKLCEATQTLNIQQRHQLITEMSGGIKKKKKKAHRTNENNVTENCPADLSAPLRLPNGAAGLVTQESA